MNMGILPSPSGVNLRLSLKTYSHNLHTTYLVFPNDFLTWDF